MTAEEFEVAIIDRLRFVDILSPRIGDQPARDFTEAFQDEMQDVVLSPELQLIVEQFNARIAELEVRLQRFMLGALGIGLTALAIAVGILIAVLS